MALSNAEHQANWRERNAERRRLVMRVATMLMRRRFAEGRTIELKLGWNTVTVDAYFLKLAPLLCDVLKTDRAIRQLRWALAKALNDRRITRGRERDRRRRST
jgi:hypothetical protein